MMKGQIHYIWFRKHVFSVELDDVMIMSVIYAAHDSQAAIQVELCNCFLYSSFHCFLPESAPDRK